MGYKFAVENADCRASGTFIPMACAPKKHVSPAPSIWTSTTRSEVTYVSWSSAKSANVAGSASSVPVAVPYGLTNLMSVREKSAPLKSSGSSSARATPKDRTSP